MKKGELKQAFDTLQYVMNKQGLEPNVITAMINNENVLKNALEELDKEQLFIPSEESVKFHAALDDAMRDLRTKNQEEFAQHEPKVQREGAFPVPPKLVNKWNKLVEKARQNFPDGAKYVDEYQEKIRGIQEQEATAEFEMVALNGFTANEVKALRFMMYGM